VATGIALAYYNLATMLDAGVPMERSLNVVASGLEDRLRRAFMELAEAVVKGNTLAETMTGSPAVFGPLDVMIVRAAEKSGSLPASLSLLAKWYEFSARIRKRILSGLLLPIFLIHLTAIFAPLPGFLLGGWNIWDYLTEVAIILSLFYVPTTAVVIVRMMPRASALRRLLDQLMLKIPVLSPAVFKLALSRYCWVFHMLTKAGLPITDCAEMAAASTGNVVVAELFRPGTASAKAGNPVSAGFSAQLPVELISIWRIGEETGELDNVTKRLADSNGQAAEFLFGEVAQWFPRLIYLLVSILIIAYIFRNLAIIMGAASQAL
jgi:type II secretory pathway component PulF